MTARTKARSEYELVVTNGRAEPVRFEAEIAPGNWTVAARSGLATRNGMRLWTTLVPANGTARLRYSLDWQR